MEQNLIATAAEINGRVQSVEGRLERVLTALRGSTPTEARQDSLSNGAPAVCEITSGTLQTLGRVEKLLHELEVNVGTQAAEPKSATNSIVNRR